MDILRCKTPDMVHIEIWTHVLTYNLLRTVMAVAAKENDIEPRKVSFKGAKQAVTAFAPKIEAARTADRGRLIDALLTTIAYHRVGDRPGTEPRGRKRRPRKANLLMQPRALPSCRKTDPNGFNAGRKNHQYTTAVLASLPSRPCRHGQRHGHFSALPSTRDKFPYAACPGPPSKGATPRSLLTRRQRRNGSPGA